MSNLIWKGFVLLGMCTVCTILLSLVGLLICMVRVEPMIGLATVITILCGIGVLCLLAEAHNKSHKNGICDCY